MPFRNEMTKSEGVTSRITRCESLVCHIKEREKLLLFHDIGDLLPLFKGGVYASRIMCACVKEDNALFLGFLYKQQSGEKLFGVESITEANRLPVSLPSNRQSPGRQSSCQSICIVEPLDQSLGRLAYGCPRTELEGRLLLREDRIVQGTRHQYAEHQCPKLTG